MDPETGLVAHRGTVTATSVPAVASDCFTVASVAGAGLAPQTVDLLRELAGAVWSPAQKWATWQGIADGSSVSAALTAMKATGWLVQFPELAALDGVEQDPFWHPEGDVLTHAGLAGDHMAAQCAADGIADQERMLLVLAATLHDVGKATHTHRHEDGRITSYGHDDAGVAPAHRFLVSMDAPSRFHDVIEPLIKEHMCAATVRKPDSRTVARLRRRLGPASLEQWVRVVNADSGGRGPGSLAGVADAWVAAAERAQTAVPPRRSRLLTGRDLIAAGMVPSEEFRAVLEAAGQAEADGAFADAAGARAWLDAFLAERR